MRFELFSNIFFASLASFAFAQSVAIRYPPPYTVVHKGQLQTVQIAQPISLQGSKTIGLVIGFRNCGSSPSPCPPPSLEMGIILYNGNFTAERHEESAPPYQNFTVQIPAQDFLPTGPAQLNVAYAALFGAGPTPSIQLLNETLRLEA